MGKKIKIGKTKTSKNRKIHKKKKKLQILQNNEQ